MTATQQRDQAIKLAKTNTPRALKNARAIADPWFRAQTLSWIARFSEEKPESIAVEAARSAAECEDNYKRSAVRAWEIAALAERSFAKTARAALREATATARCAEPSASRGEALLLLMQSAFLISRDDASKIYETLAETCSTSDHWRCKRALRNASLMLDGKREPRTFFW